MIDGTNDFSLPRRFASPAEFLAYHLGVSPPPPITVPWTRPWRLSAPAFDDDDEGAHLITANSSSPTSLVRSFSNFSEYAHQVLGIQPPPIRHIF